MATLTLAPVDFPLDHSVSDRVRLTVPNLPPEFDDPDDPEHYEFEVGQGTPKGYLVAKVKATDPDGDDKACTFLITGGNEGGYFRITSDEGTGGIRLAKEMPLADLPTFTLDLSVTDEGGAYDDGEVTIDLKRMVAITGDWYGVEATGDSITLTFTRYAHDTSDSQLAATYDVTWGTPKFTAVADHLLNPEDLVAPGQTQRTIVFEEGQNRISIPLQVNPDGNPEGLEQFRVRMNTSSGEYMSPSNPVDDKKKDGLRGRGTADVTILDSITLFGADNTIPELHDGNTSGVHYNDIDQGGVGDCYFLDAIAALAKNDPETFRESDFDDAEETFFEHKADGSLLVRYYGEGPHPVVDMTIDNGLAQSDLSKDTDEPGGQGNHEVWTIIAEKAYLKYLGWHDFSSGGKASESWNHIFGGGHHCVDPADLNDAALVDILRNDIDRLVFGTKDLPGASKKEKFTLSNGHYLYDNHAYAVMGYDDHGTPGDTEDDTIKLFNPWGLEKWDEDIAEPVMSFDEIKEYVDSISKRQ